MATLLAGAVLVGSLVQVSAAHGAKMTSQVKASGRIEHRHMEPSEVLAAVRQHFPKAEPDSFDFSIPLEHGKVQFFCESCTTLDFVITPADARGTGPSNIRAVTAAEMLIRATDVLWNGLILALRASKVHGHPKLTRCVIEDSKTMTTLLTREDRSPLRSPGAKVSYGISALFLVAMVALIWWQVVVVTEPSDRMANRLQIVLSLALAAIATPFPTVINWLDWRKTLNWKYVRVAP